MNIDETLVDERLFAPLFRPSESWSPWLAFLRASFGLRLLAGEQKLFEECTGRSLAPTGAAREVWCVVGRRGGKSRIAALIATFLAAFRDYRSVLSKGEQGVVMLIASDRNQARVLFGYVSALFSTPMLEPLVTKRWADALFLEGGVSIEVATASFRSTRGFTVLGAVLDEVAYWRGTDESSANEDAEVLAALRPAMATVPGALLVGISSPYAKRGVLWQQHDRYFGKDGDVLVWRAPSLTMNPSLDPAVVEAAYAEDEPRARAEFGAEFRGDIESFVSVEVVRSCVVPNRAELPPVRALSYRCFVDPSGGSADSFTLAIGHRERDGRIAVDALRERRAPFVPNAVVEEYAALCRAYGVSEVSGDRYAGEWPREAFKRHGIRYVPSERTKSELYQGLLPVLNGRGADLPDSPRLVAQLVSLERIVSRGGRDSIDHPRRGHDDLANAVAGLVGLLARPRSFIESGNFGGPITRYTDHGVEILSPDGTVLAEHTNEQRGQAEFWARRLSVPR